MKKNTQKVRTKYYCFD